MPGSLANSFTAFSKREEEKIMMAKIEKPPLNLPTWGRLSKSFILFNFL
jgi:hypothetical protein